MLFLFFVILLIITLISHSLLSPITSLFLSYQTVFHFLSRSERIALLGVSFASFVIYKNDDEGRKKSPSLHEYFHTEMSFYPLLVQRILLHPYFILLPPAGFKGNPAVRKRYTSVLDVTACSLL